jgi:wyosine [tRNA(Phe)-imidazoG37] synthetase (radical SAM superfamily)
VPRPEAAKGRPVVDVAQLRSELIRALACPPDTGWADLAFAGSGEPTLCANFDEATGAILEALEAAGFRAPRRIYTNGLHLGIGEVEDALAKWTECGGEVWVKLDACDDDTIERVWRVKLSAEAHLSRVWKFALRCPVGIQATIVRGAGLPDVGDLARRLSQELEHAVRLGAKIQKVHVLSPTRRAGDAEASSDIVPASREELERIAEVLKKAVPVGIETFA